MDKFLLAENPMRPESSGLWINHMLNPKTIIRCSEGHIIPPEEIYHYFQFMNNTGLLEEWTLSVYSMAGVESKENTLKLLDRAWRWFRSYLEFQSLIKKAL